MDIKQTAGMQMDSDIVRDLEQPKGQGSLFDLYNPDVLDCLSSLSNDEVFTSPKLTNQMLDLLPDEIWSNKTAKFLDPVCKSGVFLREIVKRLDKGLEKQIPDKQTRINHICKNQVFGIGITQLTALLSRRSVYCAKVANSQFSICDDFDNDMGNIIFGNVNHQFENGKCRECGASESVFGNREGLESHAYAFIHSDKDNVFKELEDMEFDVIIGNPPYQLDDGGAGASAVPIYHKFVEQAKKLNPSYLIMIIPSRWFTGGKGLDEFRDTMLNDNRIRQIHDYPNAKDCFPNIKLEGGVNYFLWEKKLGDNNYCEIFSYEKDQCISHSIRPLKEKDIETFVRYNQAISILRKVKRLNEESFGGLVSGRKPFGLDSKYKGNSRAYANCNENVFLYQNKGTGYIKRSDIPKGKEMILQHKVYITYAYGMGQSEPYQVLNTPFYGEPNSVCTETYLVVGGFDRKQTCENVISYMKTRFFRFLVLLIKNTQHGTQKVYKLVPMQDFNESWSDEKLYIKYGLSNQEIDFIESMIRPMDDGDDKPKKSKTKTTKKSQQMALLGEGDE